MKLDYFGLHGRGLMIRMALNYCNQEYEDSKMTFETYGPRKAAGDFMWNYVPELILDDGTKLAQSQAILRYIGAAYPGKNGECLYPGTKDPELTSQIDQFMELANDMGTA